MIKRLVLLPLVLVIFACSVKEPAVDYDELIKLMDVNPNDELCHWYYDRLQSQRDDHFHFISYHCIPSKDYSGNRVETKISVRINKMTVTLNSGVDDISTRDIIKK